MGRPQDGNPYRYVGRGYDPKAPGGDHHPVTGDAYECEAGTGEAFYLMRECRAGCLKPADDATHLAVFGVAPKKPEQAQKSAKADV